MVSTPTVHDEPALNVVEAAAPEKVAAIIEESTTVAAIESTPESSPAADDAVERIDIDVPREKEPAEEIVVEETLVDDAVVVEDTSDTTSDDTKEILDRYGFGAGMRMYARSLALAELEEKERAAKVAAVEAAKVAELEAAKDMEAAKAALKTSVQKKVAPKPTEESKPFVVIPSVQSVIDFETVRSELSKVVQSIASLGSMDFKTKNAAKENDINDDDVEDDVIEDGASRSTTAPQNQGCCAGAEEALEEIFREAEAWAEATYQKISSSETKAKQAPTTHWWSSLIPQRKSRKEVTESLQLDADSEKTSLTDVIKKWWTTLLCDPVILDEKNETVQPITSSSPAAK